MKQAKSVANAVAAVITNANITQGKRAELWMGVLGNMQTEGEKFGTKVRKWVHATGMTIFTIADAKAMLPLYAKYWLELNSDIAETKTPMTKRAEKAAQNKLAWLRRELRAADVKVESDPRGGANNKKGANGKAPADSKVVAGKGLPKIIEAITMVRQAAEGDLFEKDRPIFMHLLAMMETAEKTKLSGK